MSKSDSMHVPGNAHRHPVFLRWIILSTCLILPPAVAVCSENPAAGPTPVLDDVLVRARRSVEDFWGHFKSVTCVERVAQEKLGKQGKIEYTQKSTYDYLVLLNADKEDLSVEESRLQQGKTGKPKNIPLLITSGVPTLLLVFHPYYETGFTYRSEGYEVSDGHQLMRIRFQHIPGTRSTTALRLRGKDYPLDIEGTAWIDYETGTIHRIAATLPGPMSDFNLKALQMEVLYRPQEFPPGKDAYWLPSIATINIQTERQHWRNIHQYSNYKRFTVNTEDRVSR